MKSILTILCSKFRPQSTLFIMKTRNWPMLCVSLTTHISLAMVLLQLPQGLSEDTNGLMENGISKLTLTSLVQLAG